MADLPPPPADDASLSTMDGLSKATAEPAMPAVPVSASAVPSAKTVSGAKRMLLTVLGLAYAVYLLWCGALMALLPTPSGELKQLVSAGLLSAACGAVIFLLLGWALLQRIAKAKVSVSLRQQSLLKVLLLIAPGLAASIAMPLLIIREPSLSVDIVAPVKAEDFVAPLAVTLSVERAAQTLQNQGLRPVKYQWDSDGDGKPNDETVLPKTTVLFEQQGVYGVVVRIILDNGDVRRLSRRVSIATSVFAVTPPSPVVEKPVRFSVAAYFPTLKDLKDVTWDFGDGNPAEVQTVPETLHTYYATGDYVVTAVVQTQNKTQSTLKRTVTVTDPPPLPFPVTLVTEPAVLAGPSPFGALFRVETETPLKEVSWNFGDGKEERGADLIRVGHSFEGKGIYPVVTRVRSASGQLAELTTIVKVTDALSLPDLSFTGEPTVRNNTLQGELPLTVNLTPKSAVPLVTFSWEIPADSPLTADKATVTGVFRREGKYDVTLLAQNAEGKVLRLPLKIQVDPPSAEPSILAKPDGGDAPLTVVFDASQTFVPPGQQIAGFKWLFGDEGVRSGGQGELGTARMEHTFKTPGDYTVTLRVVMATGKEYTAERTIVVRKPALSACMSASRLQVQAGKGVQFDSACTTGEVVSYLWDVRDAAAPSVTLAQSPADSYIYVFDTPGDYTVSLTVKDQWGNQDGTSLSVTVTAP